MRKEVRGRTQIRAIGRCIYCDSGSGLLTDEHIIPYSLSGNGYLKNASCGKCQKIINDFEYHFSRNVFGNFRIHLNTQTRRPEQRPKTLPMQITKRGITSTKLVKIADHPFILSMPVWKSPGYLRMEIGNSIQTDLRYCSYPYIPSTVGRALGLSDYDIVNWTTNAKIDASKFARTIGKIAYCHAVGAFGLGSFDPLTLRESILGKNNDISHYVGSDTGNPPPPDTGAHLHMISIREISLTPKVRTLLAEIRLFCTFGAPGVGMPIYRVVLGHPKWLINHPPQ